MLLPHRILTASVGLAAVATVMLAAAPGSPAEVPAGYATSTDPIRAAGGWLATQFVDRSHLPAPDGNHFEDQKQHYVDYGENADVLFGLAAAKTAAHKVHVALHYLATHLAAYADPHNTTGYGPYDGSLGKAALAAIVAGADPSHFGGYNLLELLKHDECPPASTACTPGSAANIYSSISESFVVLAEARGGGRYAPSAAALDYLTSLQCRSGGFTDETTPCGTGPADLDATSYAIMALTAAHADRTAVDRATSWLHGKQQPVGYWVDQGVANVDSTGLAAAALAGQGLDVGSARSWLRRQQVPAGHAGAGALRYAGSFTPTTTSATSLSVLGTAQGLCGLVPKASLATLTTAGADHGVALFAPRTLLSSTTVRAGHAQTVTGVGFAAGERVRVSIRSRTAPITTVTADPSGIATARYRVPRALAPGRHAVVLTGRHSGLHAAAQLTVAATPTASPTTSPPGTPATRQSGSAPARTSRSAAAIPLANTGQDERQLVVLAVLAGLAIVAGVACIRLGRRHPR